ncbi:MAG: beta-ketoacyl synthase N-terminal-like domain-containing protein [Bacteroidales bacterium]|nr:beta-ketoacyl synthase N-terminal-like domain-containing protein [Bacteroidales bacterium]
MIYQVSENIISALGFSSEENYRAVKQGKTGLRLYENRFQIPEPFMASLIDKERLNDEWGTEIQSQQRYTKFEKAAILSIFKALQNTDIHPSDANVVLIVSTTKGNVELLDSLNGFDADRIHLWRSAQLIADFFEMKNRPIVVSNACISGAVAQITALRTLKNSSFDTAIVVGADMLSKFIISGFQSFKALSPILCQPFDQERIGLNLGEAAATIIYKKTDDNFAFSKETMILTAGAVSNDANHISGPSRTGAGLYQAIKKIMQNIDAVEIAFINAHGTATRYNDDMESMAITTAHLENRPINSLKGYFGHTLGAAGVLETIISSHALMDNTILKTNGLKNKGTVCPVNAVTENQTCTAKRMMKLLSGFGGCNAALLLTKIGAESVQQQQEKNYNTL